MSASVNGEQTKIREDGILFVDSCDILVKFSNGSVGSFALIGATAKGNRYIHIGW